GYVPHLAWSIRCSDMEGPNAVRAILARCSALPDRVIVNSMAGRRFHEAIGYHPRGWEYIPNGYDTALLRPDETARNRVRAELGIDPAATVIGLPARYHPMKDHASFLAAAARQPAAGPDTLIVLLGAWAGPRN